MAFVDERIAETVYERAKAFAVVREWGGGKEDRVVLAKARLEQDGDVSATRREHLEAYSYRKIVEAVHEAHVRDAAVVSRELTRRVDREAPSRRNDRWNA